MQPRVSMRGVWENRYAGEVPSMRQALFSESAGAEIEIHFTGPSLNLPLLRHGWSGKVELFLDGERSGELDLYSPLPTCTVHRINAMGDKEGAHRLVLRVVGKHHPDAHGCQVFIGQPDVNDHAEFQDVIRLNTQVALRHGPEGDFFIWLNDVGCSRSILASGCWAPEDVALFKQLVRPGDVVFDVGANVGHHSVVYSKVVGPTGRVFSFEPQRPMFNLLCANLMINNCLNVTPVRTALGDAPGRLELGVVDYSQDVNFGAVTISKLHQDSGGESVTIDTLDAFVERESVDRIDFIKLDVQTFELFVLRGGVESLKRFRPRLFVEISPLWMKRMNGYDYREVYYFLRDQGYLTLNKDLKPADPEAETDLEDESNEWDIIGVPSGQTAIAAA